jgi:glutamate synthase domain-containing protein 2
MGTAVLIATTHTQVLKVIPYHPPTQLAYQDGKYKNRFDINRGSQSLARFLAASVYEMEEAVKALGKTSIRQLSREDVFSIDRDVAEITGIDLGFHPTPRAGASKY